MFDYEKMIERAIKFFPTWSDIRKRYKKSIGGKLLSTITEESMEVEKAIEEYKNFYFLDRQNPIEVVAFCYTANIGLIEDTKNLLLIYNNEKYLLEENLNTFLEYKEELENIFYYENGKIYIREEKYTAPNITIYYNDSYMDFELEKTHIWNLYDEFACFIGLERHVNESNEDLYKRMLFFNENKPNSSIEGLKNAIISELMIEEPSLSKEDIDIEPINETNLRKAYEGFNELLDLLNKLNRDVYRWKRWDLDVWQYDFENYTIEYLPYKWNEALVKWQNGIGYDDDLKVILSNNVNETNANVTFYKKDKETLLAYIRRKNIYKNLKLQFETYNEKLNSVNVKYLIKASPIKQIDPSQISIDILEKSTSSQIVNVEDIFEIGKDIVKIENSKITDTYPYKLQFVPKDDNYNMEIYKCVVTYRNKSTKQIVDVIDLLKETDSFKLNASGNLINSSTKKTIKSTSNMISHSNLVNVDNGGFSVKNGYTIGQGAINVNGLGKNSINYSYECKLSSLDKGYIKTKNCIWQNDNLVLRTDTSSASTVEIELTANKISFDIELNNNLLIYQYNYETNNYEPEEIVGPNATWVSKETSKPRKIKVLISSVSSDKIILKNFLYSHYLIDFNVSNGKIETVNDELILPNEIYNTLTVSLKTYSTYPPVIKSIYIGKDILNTSYVTDQIYYKNNCERIFDIKSNCKVNLIKLDSANKPINTIEDYNASTSYKATSDNAYIRLDLSSWEEIFNIYTPNGSIEYLEENGKVYYNLNLKNNEIVSYLNITGNIKVPTININLVDLIKQQYSEFNITKDKVYCSRLVEGIILSINGENSSIKILKIDKSSFNKKEAYRYEINTIPDDLNVIWGSNEKNNSNSFFTENDFEYISFYPVNAMIHTATNEYNLFLNEVKNIKIVNNFAPALDSSALNFYTVEPYLDINNSVQIRFYNDTDEGRSFEELKNWSLGIKNLYLKYNADLFNKSIYEVQEQTIQDNVKLDSYIEIKDRYTLTNNSILYTYKYRLIPPTGAQVIYKTYDATQDTKELLIDEVINLNNYFTKLKYVNIDKIFLVKEHYNSTDIKDYDSYSVLKDEGIIIWTNYAEDKDKDITIHIRYSYKKQVALSYGENALYDIIPYTIDAYKELTTYNLNNMKNQQVYDLNNFEDYKNSDLVFVSCSEPSFEAQIENNYLRFNKYVEENKILIKTGYYYINGKEYYLFSNDTTLDIDTYSGIEHKNVSFNNGEIKTYKSTNNYVRNSSMLLKGMNNLYNYDCKDKLIYGISNFNKLTACDSFNYWNTFGCSLKLISNEIDEYKDFLINDVALEFVFEEEFGYAFVEITEFLSSSSYISFLSYGIDVYLGVEEKYENMKFPKTMNINLKQKINNDNNIFNIVKEDDKKYYLVIRENKDDSYGHSIIDDIIISDSIKTIYDSHNKNIDILGLNFSNHKTESSCYRMKIKSNKNCTNNFASICSDGKIKTTSNLNWGLTILELYENKEDFSKCELDNLKLTNNFLQAPSNESGYITTKPIFLNDPFTIKRLFFKINNIDIEQMEGIKIFIYTSNEKDGDYKLFNQLDKNYGFVYGSYLSKYIKIKLEIPENKIVDNFVLFAEYRSTKTNPLKMPTQDYGELISNIFDTQECLNYKVKSINILDISNINDVDIYIRAASDKYSADVWNEWEKIELNNDFKLKNNIEFKNSRFFQIKFYLKNKLSYIEFDYIDLEVI